MKTMDFRVVDRDGAHQQNLSMLQSVLRTLSPVWAQLSMVMGGAPLCASGGTCRHVPPRLRYFDLKVFLPSLQEGYTGWLDNIADALNALPLLHLGIHFRARARSKAGNPNPTARRPRREGEDVASTMRQCDPTLRFFTLFHDLHGRGFADDERRKDVDVLGGGRTYLNC
ncbi:hypothetical protein C8Q80DRAFT_947768 [Daedaleopsis nitida]|nr:hypothetical protein C8Q80DRAFT_947768 [Daedaleopsis nitida]